MPANKCRIPLHVCDKRLCALKTNGKRRTFFSHRFFFFTELSALNFVVVFLTLEILAEFTAVAMRRFDAIFNIFYLFSCFCRRLVFS